MSAPTMTPVATHPTTPVAIPAPPHPLREFWTFFSANRGAVGGLIIVVTVLLIALFAPVLAPHAPDLTNSAAFLRPHLRLLTYEQDEMQ